MPFPGESLPQRSVSVKCLALVPVYGLFLPMNAKNHIFNNVVAGQPSLGHKA